MRGSALRAGCARWMRYTACDCGSSKKRHSTVCWRHATCVKAAKKTVKESNDQTNEDLQRAHQRTVTPPRPSHVTPRNRWVRQARAESGRLGHQRGDHGEQALLLCKVPNTSVNPIFSACDCQLNTNLKGLEFMNSNRMVMVARCHAFS